MVHMAGAGPVSPGRRRGLPIHSPLPRRWSDMSGRLWWYATRRAFDTFLRQQSIDLAASLTFYATLAIVPAFMVLVELLGLLDLDRRTVSFILAILADVAPEGVADSLRDPLEGFVSTQLEPIAFVLAIGVTVASASLYLGALGRVLNRLYEIMEGRLLLLLPPLQYVVTLALLLGLCLLLVLLLGSPAIMWSIGERVGFPEQAVQVWNAARWPVLLVLAVGLTTIIYRTAPNVRHRGMRWVLPGAILAVALGALASVLLTLYMGMLYPRLDLSYGTLSGVVVMLIWLWLTNLAVVVGGCFNAEVARARRLSAGLPAEDDQLTPPIDTRRSSAFAARRHRLVREGRRHREAAARQARQSRQVP